MPGADAAAVARFRRRRKEKLVERYGGKCLDCGLVGPPFMYDFDHRDPSIKQFDITNGGAGRSWDKTIAEADKCDLVCANCHRMRTHRQRCQGCKWCSTTIPYGAVGSALDC